MDSLQQLFEDYTKKFFTLDITSLGVTEFENQAITGFKEYLMKHMSLLIENVDNTLKDNPKLRENWTIHKKEKRLLVMQSGNLVFERRYFYNTKTDKYAFLTDNLIGIEANERVDKGLKVAICNEAANQSYFRTAKATCDGRVSKQTVQRITREIKLKELPGKDLSKEPLIPILHIQADEDHVAMQDGSNRWHRIAVAHEPRKKRGKKAYLPNKSYVFDQAESSEEFWNRVWNEICKNYNLAKDAKIYVHGDGASWIKAACEYIPNSQFVLDEFHALKYLKQIIPRQEKEYPKLAKLLYSGRKTDFYKLAKKAVGSYKINTDQQMKAIDYILKHWSAISIWRKDQDAGPCCAEGLVSHCLSSRFSSRPMGWGKEGLMSVTKIRELNFNGHPIDLTNFPRKKTDKEFIDIVGSLDISNLQEKTSQKMSLLPMPSSILSYAKKDAYGRLFDKVKQGGLHF